MDTPENVREAIEVLQQLGLKEYEARCFVGLTRLSTGTAKSLSDLTEVPRTRVYDAIRVLEAKGLVEIQHSSPQQFRAVSLGEATETLRDQYDDRIERLHDSLGAVTAVDEEEESPIQEVWAMSGREAIENRTDGLLETATEEIVLVVGDESLLTEELVAGDESLLTEELVATLNDVDGDIELVVGALTEPLKRRIQAAVPDATTFVSGLEWLHAADAEDETAIGRLLLVDRSTILVSSIIPDSGEEQAIFGEGFGNGLVVIARRLMAQGLIPARDPTR
ncbi:TrmB family transcriptional regulator [Halolamina sediminis]|uniref:TrmB family transcriptional regulator n=1 Tax=Halolamina sediminis TaxID=1480675 RepID=UPI0006B4F9CB|nr:helix-turn-helix domain-containing protein [Halolamina sediminis]